MHGTPWCCEGNLAKKKIGEGCRPETYYKYWGCVRATYCEKKLEGIPGKVDGGELRQEGTNIVSHQGLWND